VLPTRRASLPAWRVALRRALSGGLWLQEGGGSGGGGAAMAPRQRQALFFPSLLAGEVRAERQSSSLGWRRREFGPGRSGRGTQGLCLLSTA